MGYHGALLQTKIQDFLDIFGGHRKKLGSELLYSLEYHPQIDGQIEEVDKSLGNLLRSLSGENPNQWDLALAQAEFAYNDLVNISIGKSPFQIVYGIS